MVAQLVEALHCRLEGHEFESLMVSVEFFIDIILLAALGLTQFLTEISTRNISWEMKVAGV